MKLMKSKILLNMDYILGFFCIVAVFILLIMFANLEVQDLDLWLHLKAGDYIFHNRYVPDKDIFSYTVANKPWINHEWLFQVISYLIYNRWGADGLSSMQVMVVALTFFILFLIAYNRRNHLWVAFLLLAMLSVFRIRFTIRPDIYSLLFFTTYLFLLNNHLKSKWIVYTLPIIQILWVNFHGFFFLGIILLFLMMASELVKRKIKLPCHWNRIARLDDTEFKRLKMLFLLVILASFANPQTIKGFFYPFGILIQLCGKSRIFFSYIQELRRPISLMNLFTIDDMIYYKFFIFLSSVSFFLNRKNINLNHIFLWIIFLVISLIAVRNIVFFSLVAFLAIVENVNNLKIDEIVPVNFRQKKFKYITTSILKLIFILYCLRAINGLSQRGYFDFEKFEMKSIIGGISKRRYPEKAINFILENKISGNIFNEFNSGAYLVGRCFPQIKVFIDGRTEVYGSDFFENYRKLFEDKKLFEEAIEKYNITSILLISTFDAIPTDLLKYIYKRTDWKLVYFDDDAVIFLKNIPQNRTLIDKLQINLEKRIIPHIDLKKLGTKDVLPYQYVNRAYTLYSLELYDQVILESMEALKIRPDYGEAYKMLGESFDKKNNIDEAFKNLRLAAFYLPRSAKVRLDLGLSYAKLEDIANAIIQMKLAIKYNPKLYDAYHHLILLYNDQKDFKNVINLLKKISTIKDFELIAESLSSQGDFSAAANIYKLALKRFKKQAILHEKLAQCFVKLNKSWLAENEFKKAIEIDPKLVSSYNSLGLLYANQDKFDEACLNWSKALRIDMQNKESKEFLKKFNCASILDKN